MARIERITNCVGIGFYSIMLKGKSMDYECIAASYCRCVSRKPVVGRYGPAKTETRPAKMNTPFKLSRENKNQYLKLYNGDIYDVKSNTILDREALKALLDG